jgi:hypothetical protein
MSFVLAHSHASMIFHKYSSLSLTHTTQTATHTTIYTPPSPPAMQSPAAAAARSLPRHVVRLSAALAALLGQVEPPDLPEDELLVVLREAGLITYPSPLLGPLLELPGVVAAEVLPRLELPDRAMVARVGRASRAVVVASGLCTALAPLQVGTWRCWCGRGSTGARRGARISSTQTWNAAHSPLWAGTWTC